VKKWFEHNREKTVYIFAFFASAFIAVIFAQQVNLSGKISREREINEALETKLLAAAAETHAAKKAISKLSEANSDLSNRIASMGSGINTAHDRIADLDRENSELQSQIETLSKTNSELTLQIEALTRENSEPEPQTVFIKRQ
jgi:septal ring factor EnvC (AmiA/AmiB activator)